MCKKCILRCVVIIRGMEIFSVLIIIILKSKLEKEKNYINILKVVEKSI